MSNSLARLRELEALVKNQPVLEARLNVVLEEKEMLRIHLEEKEKEASEFRLRYEESVTEIKTLESLRVKEEVEFNKKLVSSGSVVLLKIFYVFWLCAFLHHCIPKPLSEECHYYSIASLCENRIPRAFDNDKLNSCSSCFN